MLESHREPGSEASEVVRLRREIAGLEQELQEAKDEAAKAKQAATDSLQVIRALRNSPLKQVHDVLRMVFGEISRVDAEALAAAPPDAPSVAAQGHDPRWEIWKSRLGVRAAEVIDLLLSHGQMNTSQLAAAMHADRRTVNRTIYTLSQATLVNKNGGVFSLKDLSARK